MRRYDCGNSRYSWSRPARAVLLILLVLLLGRSAPAAEDAAKTSHMVAMRDGVRLATDVYLPPGVAEPVPAILIRTPYGIKDAGKALGLMAGLKGYALVAQDMRGRGGSEGNDAVVFHNDGWGERRDGRDTLQWIAGQKWCNGKIATWGGSALGITQNMLAPDAPETLKAQHVLVAFSDMYRQCVFQGGAFRRELMEKWLQDNHFDPNNLKTFLAHPKYDGFWAERQPGGRGRQGQRAGDLHRRLVRHFRPGRDQFVRRHPGARRPRRPGKVPARDGPVGAREARGTRIPGQRRQVSQGVRRLSLLRPLSQGQGQRRA